MRRIYTPTARNSGAPSHKQVWFLLLVSVVFLTSVAGAQAISPRSMISLTAAVPVGGSAELTPVGGNVGNPFVVPRDEFLVLTDLVISPQQFPPAGDYFWQVTPLPAPPFTTAISVTSSAADASSFQVHLTTGMVFDAGSKVRISLVFGSSPINVSAFGYLARARPEGRD